MEVQVVNLDKCIAKLTEMQNIEDSVVGKVYVPMGDKNEKDSLWYALYQEYGFRVRRRDGSTRKVLGYGYMASAMDINLKYMVDTLTSHIKRELAKGKRVALKPVIADMVRRVQATAKAMAPVKTGRLRSSIVTEVK